MNIPKKSVKQLEKRRPSFFINVFALRNNPITNAIMPKGNISIKAKKGITRIQCMFSLSN